MDEPDDRQLDPHEETTLNRLVAESVRLETEDGVEVAEETVLAYVWGTADASQVEAVQVALERSAAFRGKLHALIKAQEEAERSLSTPEAERAFNEPIRAPIPRMPAEVHGTDAYESSPDPDTILSRFRSLVLHPGFAYGLLLLVLVYPAYRFIAGRAEGTQSIVATQIEVLGGQPGDIPRGESLGTLPAITLSPETTQLSLLLRAPEDFDAGAPYEVSLVLPSGEAIAPAFAPHSRVIGNTRYIILGLSRRAVPSGSVVVRLNYTSSDPSRKAGRFSYALRLSAGR
ncbi:MAG TPA: hypothetical protein VGV60_01905 [Candidatus Polarisedimenticolia bacterium]|jgi:hypothetical protein|nr:hypothetical protein [Candidatus Polarisedimenticolia bacterium]